MEDATLANGFEDAAGATRLAGGLQKPEKASTHILPYRPWKE